MPNPYNDLIEIFREEGNRLYEPSFYFAEVTSSYPNLKVKFDNAELDRKMLLIDSFLLRQQKEILTEIDESETHTHTIKTLTNLIRKGDRVLLVRDKEKFVILSKVVSI